MNIAPTASILSTEALINELMTRVDWDYTLDGDIIIYTGMTLNDGQLVPAEESE